jgi:hypothetical protein
MYPRDGSEGHVPHWLGVPGVLHLSRRRSTHASAPSFSPTTEDGIGTGTGTDTPPERTSVLVALSRTTGTKLFVSGDRSSVGKTTTCLGLLASLVESGVPPSSLAYIKPVTQCEAEQPVTRYCRAIGIRDAPGARTMCQHVEYVPVCVNFLSLTHTYSLSVFLSFSVPFPLRTSGPVIFYKGFTRAFLAGETPSSAELLDQVT